MTDEAIQPSAPAQDQDDSHITPKTQQGYIRTAKDSNDEPAQWEMR